MAGAVIEGPRRALPEWEYWPAQQAELKCFAATMHSIHNQLVEIDGNRGHLESYAVASHWLPTTFEQHQPPDLVLGVRYQDQVVRTSNGWRIAHRSVDIDWRVGDYPEHWDPTRR
jgi:hypothetical protein